MQSFNGPDTAGLRYRNLDTESAEVFVEEERSRDGEMGHAGENVGFLAMWD